MEKVRFAFADGNGEDEFFVLEETMINGSEYILVTDSEDDDAECLILKETGKKGEGECVYEIVEDETELLAVSKVFEELLKPHLKTGKVATWVRNLITESSQLWAATKLNKVMPDLVKQTGLNNWKNYKTLIGTGLVAGVPILGIIFSIPYAFNAWLTNIQKKAGKIGIMQAMNKIDDPRVFADPPTDNEPKHIKTSSKTVQETILPVKNTNLLAQINQQVK